MYWTSEYSKEIGNLVDGFLNKIYHLLLNINPIKIRTLNNFWANSANFIAFLSTTYSSNHLLVFFFFLTFILAIIYVCYFSNCKPIFLLIFQVQLKICFSSLRGLCHQNLVLKSFEPYKIYFKIYRWFWNCQQSK